MGSPEWMKQKKYPILKRTFARFSYFIKTWYAFCSVLSCAVYTPQCSVWHAHGVVLYDILHKCAHHYRQPRWENCDYWWSTHAHPIPFPLIHARATISIALRNVRTLEMRVLSTRNKHCQIQRYGILIHSQWLRSLIVQQIWLSDKITISNDEAQILNGLCWPWLANDILWPSTRKPTRRLNQKSIGIDSISWLAWVA